jgi:hypothetical protein
LGKPGAGFSYNKTTNGKFKKHVGQLKGILSFCRQGKIDFYMEEVYSTV